MQYVFFSSAETNNNMVGEMVQNSQMSYSFTLNDLILIHEYIHSHSTKKILCNTVAIFIQHFVNSAKFTNSIFIHL